MRILITLLLISAVSFGQVGIYRTDDIFEDEKVIGKNYYNNFGELLRKVIYVKDKDGTVSKGNVYEVLEEEVLLGVEEYFYNNGEISIVIFKDKNNEIKRISWYYEKNGEKLEEVRDGKNNLVRYYSHKEDGFEDVTKRVLSENNLDKLVIIEKDMIHSLMPLESLQDRLNSNENLEVGTTLKTLDFTYSNRMENLGAQIVVDSIKDYVGSEVVLMPGLAFDNVIEIGQIKYKDIKRVIKEEELYLTRIRGDKLVELVENFLLLPPNHREFLHSAGLIFERNKNGKLKEVKVEGSLVDERREYTVVIPKYIKEGKGIYFAFGNETAYELPYKTSILVSNYLSEINSINDSYILEKRHN